MRKVAIGDSIAAKIVGLENEEGYIELSLKEAKQALVWSEAEKAIFLEESLRQLKTRAAEISGIQQGKQARLA